jgi:hypothetical protein
MTAIQGKCGICGAPVTTSGGFGPIHDQSLGEMRVSMIEYESIMADASEFSRKPSARKWNQLHRAQLHESKALKVLAVGPSNASASDVGTRFEITTATEASEE